VLDAAALERKGVHTVTIVWDTFERAARVAARVQKVPDIEMAVITHRKGSDGAAEQQAKARAIAPQVVKLLLAS
jgi:hypothetical protein